MLDVSVCIAPSMTLSDCISCNCIHLCLQLPLVLRRVFQQDAVSGRLITAMSLHVNAIVTRSAPTSTTAALM